MPSLQDEVMQAHVLTAVLLLIAVLPSCPYLAAEYLSPESHLVKRALDLLIRNWSQR
jgi:hypothetical protein